MNQKLKNDLRCSAVGVAVGATGGAWFGSSIGVAAFGAAAAGTLPVLATGAIVGGLGTYASLSISRRIRDRSRHDEDVDASE